MGCGASSSSGAAVDAPGKSGNTHHKKSSSSAAAAAAAPQGKSKSPGSRLGTTPGAIPTSESNSTNNSRVSNVSYTGNDNNDITSGNASVKASNSGGSYSTTHKKRPKFNLVIPNPFDSAYVIVRSSTNLPRSCPYESTNIAKDRRSRTVVFVGIVNMEKLQRKHLEIEFFKHLDIYRMLDCIGIAKIVDMFDVQNTSGNYYIVYEFIQGKELSFMLDNAGPLGVGMARVVLRKLLVIVQYLHSQHIIHSNLKTASVRCTEWPWYPATSNKEVYITGFSKCVRTTELPASTAFSDAMYDSMPGNAGGGEGGVGGLNKEDEYLPARPTNGHDDADNSLSYENPSSTVGTEAAAVAHSRGVNTVAATEARMAASEAEFIRGGGIAAGSTTVYTPPEVRIYLQQLYLAKKHVRSSILSHSLSPVSMFGNIVPYVDENMKLSNPYSTKESGGGGGDDDPRSPRNLTGSPLNAETIAANSAGRYTEFNTATNVAIRRASAAFFTNSPPFPGSSSNDSSMPLPPGSGGFGSNSVVPVTSPARGDEGGAGGKFNEHDHAHGKSSTSSTFGNNNSVPILSYAVDIYALGVIFAECMLGKLDHREDMLRKLDDAVVEGKIPQVDKELILKMTSVQPWARPTAAEVTKMLQQSAMQGAAAGGVPSSSGGGKSKRK